jgi:hypothetical protein
MRRSWAGDRDARPDHPRPTGVTALDRPDPLGGTMPANVLGGPASREAAWADPRRTARLPYFAQIFQITPVPGIWTSGPLPAPTKWVSAPLSRTAP